MQDFQNGTQNPMWCNFMDVINILSFIVGLQNIELNVTANDLEKAGSSIVDVLNGHLQAQDAHLKNQDEHLRMQDERMYHIETMLMELLRDRKENI